MLLKQQFFTASGSNQRSEQAFQYASSYLQHRDQPLLQILPLKLAEWIAKNLAEELNLPDTGDEWSSEELNSILTHCLVSDQQGNNLHTSNLIVSA